MKRGVEEERLEGHRWGRLEAELWKQAACVCWVGPGAAAAPQSRQALPLQRAQEGCPVHANEPVEDSFPDNCSKC